MRRSMLTIATTARHFLPPSTCDYEALISSPCNFEIPYLRKAGASARLLYFYSRHITEVFYKNMMSRMGFSTVVLASEAALFSNSNPELEPLPMYDSTCMAGLPPQEAFLKAYPVSPQSLHFLFSIPLKSRP